VAMCVDNLLPPPEKKADLKTDSGLIVI